MPYALSRRIYSTAALPLHKLLLDPILLKRGLTPQHISLDEAHSLQNQFPCRDWYKYDLDSKQARAWERLTLIKQSTAMDRPLRILEVGAGDGRLALMLAELGHDTVMLDLDDWRDEDVRKSRVQFLTADASSAFPLESGTFDLCVSFNSMEHISNPTNAFREMMRVLRPGGRLHLLFSPLFNSAWGLHAYRLIHFPFPQFLLSSEDMTHLVQDRTNYDLGRERADFQYVNEWPAAKFVELFRLKPSQGESHIEIHRDLSHLPFIYKYKRAFVGRGITLSELTAAGIRALVCKAR